MSDTVLEAQDLAKHYPVSQGFLKPKALARALDGVSFEVHAGRTLAVVLSLIHISEPTRPY